MTRVVLTLVRLLGLDGLFTTAEDLSGTHTTGILRVARTLLTWMAIQSASRVNVALGIDLRSLISSSFIDQLAGIHGQVLLVAGRNFSLTMNLIEGMGQILSRLLLLLPFMLNKLLVSSLTCARWDVLLESRRALASHFRATTDFDVCHATESTASRTS